MTFELQVKKIQDSIKKSEKPLMLYDMDTDGSTSYLQLKNRYKKIIGFPMGKDLNKQKKIIEQLEFNPDLIIIFDIPFLEDDFLELIKDKKIIWADHHPTNSQEQIEKYNITHLNPLDFDKNDNRPSSYIAYNIAPLKENLWLVSLGSVADFYLLDVLIDFYNFNSTQFNILFKLSEEKRKELFDFIKKYKFNEEKIIDKRNDWIRYLTYEAKIIELKNFFDFTCRLEKDEDTIKAFKIIEKLSLVDLKAEISAGKGFLFEDYSSMMTKYKQIFKKAYSKGEKEFFFYEYIGKTSYSKTLSEELSYKFSNSKLIAVCFKKPNKDMYSCSFRGNHGFEVNKMVSDSLIGLSGRGGGHPFAAGAAIKEKDYNIFKKRIKDYLDISNF